MFSRAAADLRPQRFSGTEYVSCDEPKFPVARRFSGHLQALRVKCPKFLDPDVVTLAAVRKGGLPSCLESWNTSSGIPRYLRLRSSRTGWYNHHQLLIRAEDYN